MLTSDQTLVSSRASQTLPGSAGSTVYPIVAGEGLSGSTVRRVAATALTTPQLLSIAHELRGKNFSQRVATLIKYSWSKLDHDVETTGGIVPTFSIGVTINRPVQSAGTVTSTLIKDGIGTVMDLILISGNLDKILNREA